MASKYPDLYHRLVATIDEPTNEQDCWRWSGYRDRWGYGRFSLRIGSRYPVQLMAHIAVQVWLNANPENTSEFYQAYKLMTLSGLEVDHLCGDPRCINPDHHEWVTASENCKRRSSRAFA